MIDGLDDAYPLTPLQQGMLYETLKHPETDVYVTYILIDIHGDLDSGNLRYAWQAAMQQFETLRTRFVWEGLDEPLQLVNSIAAPVWTDCGLPPDNVLVDCANVNAVTDYWLRQERDTPLPISETPPTRLRLINLFDSHHVLIWTVHHLLADNWSTPLVLEAVASHYSAVSIGSDTPQSKTDQGFVYSHYVDWLSRATDQLQLNWWQQTLAESRQTPIDIEQAYCVGADEVHGSRHERVCFKLTADQSLAVAALSRTTGCTLSSVMHAAWALVVARYAGTSDATFGTSVSGRSCGLSGIEKAVGLFLNTLPTYININPGASVDGFLNDVQSQLFKKIQFEHVALTDLLNMYPFRGTTTSFDSVLVVEAHSPELFIEIPGTNVSLSNIRYSTDSNFPLTALVFPGERLSIHLSLIHI